MDEHRWSVFAAARRCWPLSLLGLFAVVLLALGTTAGTVVAATAAAAARQVGASVSRVSDSTKTREHHSAGVRRVDRPGTNGRRNALLDDAPVAGRQSASTANVARCAEFRIAILTDVSRSMASATVQRLSTNDLAQVVELVRQCGGRVAFGLIAADSRSPLLRLQVDGRPLAPEPPAVSGITMTDNARRQRYAKAVAAFTEAERGWRDRSDTSARRFLEQVDSLLRVTTVAQSTAWCVALRRADAFLNEPSGDVRADADAPMRIVLAQTDAQDSGTAQCSPMRTPSVRLLVVNGFASVGNAARFLEIVPFEQQSGAIAYIAKLVAGISDHAVPTSLHTTSGPGRGGAAR